MATYRRPEGAVCDLDRLSEILENLTYEIVECKDQQRQIELTATMSEVLRDKMKEFRATYYGWYHSPPAEDSPVSQLARR